MLEHGAYNVNGSARQALQLPGMTWTGCDLAAGPDVDRVGRTYELIAGHENAYDLVVACEAYEHDREFWLTNAALRAALRPGGLYVVTTPANGFPYHAYPRDYYRFQEDAFRDVFFEGYEVLNFEKVGTYHHGTNCGLARKPA